MFRASGKDLSELMHMLFIPLREGAVEFDPNLRSLSTMLISTFLVTQRGNDERTKR